MYEAYQIAERIKVAAKSRNIVIKVMLEECGLSKNTLSSMISGGSTPKSENLAKIADYLNCSVDYLLGRTDNPNVTGISVTDNNQMSLTGNNSISINANPNNSTSDDRQLFDMIKNLDLVDRSKIILHIDELKNKK